MNEKIRNIRLHRMTRRQFLWAGGAFLGVAASSPVGLIEAFAGTAGSPQGPLFVIRQAPSANVSYANMYVAQGAGILKKYGIDGPIKLFDVGYLGTEATLAGQTDVSGIVEFPFLGFFAKGAKIITVAVDAAGAGLRIVVPSAIQQPQDLRNKRIGLIFGSTAEYAFSLYMTRYGLDKGEVKVINISAADLAASLVRGYIDGFVWIEPAVSNAFNILGDKIHMLSPGIETVYFGRSYLTMLRPWAERNRKHVEDYLRALIEANEFILRHPRETAEIVGRKLNVTPEFASKQMKNDGWKWDVFLDKASVDNLKQAASWMKDQGKIKQVPDVDSAVDPSYLKAVNPSAVKL